MILSIFYDREPHLEPGRRVIIDSLTELIICRIIIGSKKGNPMAAIDMLKLSP
jgi:hypothetical protein